MRTLVVSVGLIALTGCTTIQLGERNFIQADRPDRPAPAQPINVQTLRAMLPAASLHDERITTADGATLRGITVRQPGALATVLYFGGNAFHIDQHAGELLPALAACHVNVTIFDYRGYGRSSGVPAIANMKDDALQIFDHVNADHPGTVLVHGQSLGSFVAAYVAQQRPARALVLESTTTNVRD